MVHFEINNGGKRRLTAEEKEHLTTKEQEEVAYPLWGLLVSNWLDNIMVDFAVDRVVTTMNKDMMQERILHAQWMAEQVVLHDEKLKKPKEMEIAVQVRCATSVRKCHTSITHIYLALVHYKNILLSIV